jgi:hypothetical protein
LQSDDVVAVEAIAQQVRTYLQSAGAAPRPGVTPRELRDWKQRMGRELPRDFANFYHCLNGTEEPAEWLFDLLPLDRVGPVPTVLTSFAGIPDFTDIGSTLPDANEYCAFADVMIWSHVLAVRLASGKATDVVWLCGSSYAKIAPTFSEFLGALFVRH